MREEGHTPKPTNPGSMSSGNQNLCGHAESGAGVAVAGSKRSTRGDQQHDILATVSLTRSHKIIKATVIISLGKNRIVDVDHNGLTDVRKICKEFSSICGDQDWYVSQFLLEDNKQQWAEYIQETWESAANRQVYRKYMYKEFMRIEPHLLYACDLPVGNGVGGLVLDNYMFKAETFTVRFEDLVRQIERHERQIDVHSHTNFYQDKALHNARYAAIEIENTAAGGSRPGTRPKFLEYRSDTENMPKPSSDTDIREFIGKHYNTSAENYEGFKDWMREEGNAVAFKYPIIRMGYADYIPQNAYGVPCQFPHCIYFTNSLLSDSHIKFANENYVWSLEDFDPQAYGGTVIPSIFSNPKR